MVKLSNRILIMSIQLPSYRQCCTRFCCPMMWDLIRYVLSSGSMLVLLSGQKDRVIVTPGSSPGVQWMHAAFLFFHPTSIRKDRPKWSQLIRGRGWIHKAGRIFRKVFLRPSIASHCPAWMLRVAVHPLRHRADNTPPDGSLLWPVTPRSWGQSRVNRGQSLRTPHRVPLSSQGRVAR